MPEDLSPTPEGAAEWEAPETGAPRVDGTTKVDVVVKPDRETTQPVFTAKQVEFMARFFVLKSMGKYDLVKLPSLPPGEKGVIFVPTQEQIAQSVDAMAAGVVANKLDQDAQFTAKVGEKIAEVEAHINVLIAHFDSYLTKEGVIDAEKRTDVIGKLITTIFFDKNNNADIRVPQLVNRITDTPLPPSTPIFERAKRTLRRVLEKGAMDDATRRLQQLIKQV